MEIRFQIACADRRPLRIHENSDSAAKLIRDRANLRHYCTHVIMRGMTHIEPEDISIISRRIMSGFSVAGPSVQIIFVLRITSELL